MRANSPLLGQFCGPDHRGPQVMISSLNAFYLKFKTDGSISNRGFSAYYTSIDVGKENIVQTYLIGIQTNWISLTQKDCGGIHHELAGTIRSPQHPENYPSNLDCRWIIDVPPGHAVQVGSDYNHYDLELE